MRPHATSGKVKTPNKKVKLIFTGTRAPPQSMVSGFRAIHGREIAEMLIKKEMQLHPKEAARNTNILVERLGLISGESRNIADIAKKHNLSEGRVREIYNRMLRSAIHSEAIRTELFAQAGINLTPNELVQRLIKKQKK